MTLLDTWSTAWRSRYGLADGWLVNLEPTAPVALGEVGVVTGGALAYETTLAQRGVTGLAVDPETRRDDTGWNFVSSKDVQVALSSGGQTDGAAGAVADAGWKLDASFGQQAGAAAYGNAMWWTRYSDIGRVRAELVQAARDGRLHKGESVVIEQQLTGKGVVLLSNESNGSLSADAHLDVKPGGTPSIADLSGSLHVSRSSGAAATKSFADGSVLAMRVLLLGTRGLFWWRKLEAFGILPTDADEVEEVSLRAVEGDGPDEYFALI